MSNSSKTIFSFLLGASAGILVGILYAPDKGVNTREKLSFLLEKYRKQLTDLIEQLVNTKNIPSSKAKTEGEKVIKDAREKAEKLLQDVDNLIGQIKNKTN
ncbi:MAG TPA: YtxH domain-containing protein [Cyclobacteriaceae bacterium]|nr:YtxH domain-containing protein [Cyclobacteriaceae bacterium]